MLSRDIITIFNLACHRGTRLLIDNFSDLVRQGETVWLTGPNGIGKSTLLRVLAGVQTPLRGRVAVNSDIFYQPSTPGFDPRLTLVQNLDWWQACHRTQDLRPADVLETMGLAPHAHTQFAALSQGQQQRAILARLNLSAALLWLLDEPLSHLDEVGQRLFAAMARIHCKRGGAMIAATHATALLPEARVIDLRNWHV